MIRSKGFMMNDTEGSKSSVDAFAEAKNQSEEQLLGVLADIKWRDGFICRKCGHTHYCKGKKPYSRRCTRCKTEESAVAHTVFHRCKIPLSEALDIAMTICCNPDISTYELSRRMSKRQMTCWKFKTRILECLTDNEKAASLRYVLESFNGRTV
ncbi:MAG TPA: transposase [Bacteroidales bacterium]|nr:transposase [Bacteroidales bacterium]